MSKSYIVGKSDKQLYYVSRHYIGRYEAIDRWDAAMRVYGGRVTASSALTFETVEAAQGYINRNGLDGCGVYEYNTCMNNVIFPAVA